MINYIIGSLTTLIALYIGYCIGKGSSIIPEETQKQVRRLVQALPIKKDIGGIQRPSQRDIERYENPLLKEEEDAMSETLREIIK